ncbi:Bug family tripartite tricarboxylate transporter substrate binding protein [Natrarchaeobaculum aegyptiacum]|nr:tripartite tricarboxylate transporter substrate-binding protein [Natrarchaeobaculum aegyptiacum]
MHSRRSYLRVAAAGSVASSAMFLTGCLGDDNGDDGADDEFPSENFNVTIPWGQGGGTDIFTRQIWQTIADQNDVGAQFENVTGAAGMRGITELYNSEGNGYNLAPMNSPSVSHFLIQEPGFTIDEFRHIGGYARTVWVLATDPDEGFEGLDDVSDAYDAGDISNIAGQQPGEPNHVLSELIRDELDVQWDSYVAYDGSGPIIEAIAGGEVPAGIVTDTAAADAQDQIDVVTALHSEGTPLFPDLSNYTDYGHEVDIDFMGGFLRSFMAPPDTPDDRVDELTVLLQEALESEEMQEWAEDTGNEVEFLGGEDYVEDVLVENQERIPEIIDIDDL